MQALVVLVLVFVVFAVSEAAPYKLVFSIQPFTYPQGVAVDSSGNVYVADTSKHCIQKFDSSGTFLAKWGGWGTGDEQFRYPCGIAADPSGNVYVADTINSHIKKFDSSGTLLTKWGGWGTGDGQFRYPYGVAVDSSGNVYVSDTGNHRIQKFDSFGTFLAKWGSNGSGDGQFRNPYGMAVDPSGSVYVADTDNHRIQKFDSSGTLLAKWGSNGSGDGQLRNPFGIAADSSGNVYIADKGNHRIQKFDSFGTFLAKWGGYGTGDGEFHDPFGIAADSSGNVYVADTGNHRIQKFDCENTPPGDIVVVCDAGTGTTITFDRVDQGGDSTVTTTQNGPAPPAGLKLVPSGMYYQINTTASYSGPIQIAIEYYDTGLTDEQERALRLRCYQEATDEWVDITTDKDMVKNIIHGETEYLSFYALTYNAAPVVMIRTPISGHVQPVGEEILFEGLFTDPDVNDTHTATWVVSSKNWAKEYQGTVADACVSGSFQLPEASIYSIKLTVTDQAGASAEAKTLNNDPELPAFVVIYDPDCGFVTGGGWIDSPAGAYTADRSLAGKANFGFVSKCKRGTTTPSSQTQFHFRGGDMSFHSTKYQWLVVAGAHAKYKGSGTINGKGDYGFVLTAMDGAVSDGGSVDKFRVKIWDKATDRVVYDNQMGDAEDADASNEIRGGSIVIHRK